jgi:uncharacterized OsmC-like protein
MKRDVIDQTIDRWTKEPEKAQSNPVVKARSDGAQAMVESGRFYWRADLPPALGGENQAASPTALLLGALAGCAVTFIRDTLAPQFNVRVHSVQAEATCHADMRGLLGMQGAAPDLDGIELTIRIDSPDGDDKVQALYEAWQERCPVHLALTKPMTVRTFLAKPV